MKIQFVHNLTEEETTAFEGLYEEELQFNPGEKQKLLDSAANCPNKTWMLINGKLAGEIYGMTPLDLYVATGEEIEDCDRSDSDTIYCYSTSILSAFQGQGLGKLLKAHWLGILVGQGIATVCGHATAPGMVAINKTFGAEFGAVHEHWYGTDRTALFYTIKL